MDNALTKAREAKVAAVKKAGGGQRLATCLGITRYAVHHWDVIPPRHLLKVSEITGIPLPDLRPDLAGAAP